LSNVNVVGAWVSLSDQIENLIVSKCARGLRYIPMKNRDTQPERLVLYLGSCLCAGRSPPGKEGCPEGTGWSFYCQGNTLSVTASPVSGSVPNRSTCITVAVKTPSSLLT
jgi:hypothetical protein